MFRAGLPPHQFVCREDEWPPCMPLRVCRTLGIALNSALAHADVCVVHNDWPQWRELTAADYSGMRRTSSSTAAGSCSARRGRASRSSSWAGEGPGPGPSKNRERARSNRHCRGCAAGGAPRRPGRRGVVTAPFRACDPVRSFVRSRYTARIASAMLHTSRIPSSRIRSKCRSFEMRIACSWRHVAACVTSDRSGVVTYRAQTFTKFLATATIRVRLSRALISHVAVSERNSSAYRSSSSTQYALPTRSTSSRSRRSRRSRRLSVWRRGCRIAATKTFVSSKKVRVVLSDAGTDLLPDLPDDRVDVLPREFLLEPLGEGLDVELLQHHAPFLRGRDEELRPFVDARCGPPCRRRRLPPSRIDIPLWHLTVVMALYHPSGGRRLSSHPGDLETEGAKDLDSALAHADVCTLHNDCPNGASLGRRISRGVVETS